MRNSTAAQIDLHLSKVASDEGSTNRVLTDWLSYHLSAAIWLYSASRPCQRLRCVEDPNPTALTIDWLGAAQVADLNAMDG